MCWARTPNQARCTTEICVGEVADLVCVVELLVVGASLMHSEERDYTAAKVVVGCILGAPAHSTATYVNRRRQLRLLT